MKGNVDCKLFTQNTNLLFFCTSAVFDDTAEILVRKGWEIPNFEDSELMCHFFFLRGEDTLLWSKAMWSVFPRENMFDSLWRRLPRSLRSFSNSLLPLPASFADGEKNRSCDDCISTYRIVFCGMRQTSQQCWFHKASQPMMQYQM